MISPGVDRSVPTNEEKRALLERLLRERAAAGSASPAAIPRTTLDGPSQLSFSQQRLWLFDQLEPNSSAYNISFGLRIEGVLDRAALERSLERLATRHESLRMTFTMLDGEPRHVVSAVPAWPLEFASLTSATEPSSRRIAQLLMSETNRPFDLRSGPLCRAKLFRVAEELHLLVFVLPHIVCDGWSVGILVRELSECYTAVARGIEPALQPLPINYRDFAVWQRARIRTADMTASLDFWRRKLARPLPTTELPTDRRRPSVQTYRPGTAGSHIDPGVEQGLKALGASHGATLFMTTLAAFKVLIARHSGADDIIVGTPVSGRLHPEVEGLVGVFINTLPLRTDLSENPAFRTILERVRDTTIEAFAHQELPFELLVEAVQPQRSPNRTPLFQILFNKLPPARELNLNWTGLRVSSIEEPAIPAHFDLTVYIREERPSTKVLFVYNADLFEPARMEDLLEQYVDLLRKVVEKPDAPVRQHPLATARCRRVTPDLSAMLPPGRGGDLLGLIGKNFRQAPDHTAVEDSTGTLTYDALMRQSAALAVRLRERKIGAGDVIGVYANRDKRLLTALLGILRAGAAFAIFDPAYPAARLIAALTAARPVAWLHCVDEGNLPRELSDAIQGTAQPLMLAEGSTLACEGKVCGVSATPYPADPDQLAYVAFTSGTTGGVKGILGAHGPVAHFLTWYERTFSLSPGDRFSMLSGLSHDPLLRDVFAPLWVGGTLCVPSPDELLNPAALRAWMAREGVTVSHLTPPLARVLTEGATAGELPNLRLVCLGGDVLTSEVVRALRRVAPNARIVNFYGATETPQAMGWYEVPSDFDDHPRQTVPLGRGIDDVQLVVLAENGQLAGIGELGEIVIRTPHLARGYLGDDALTAARLVVNHFTEDPDDRMYRTGDLGRFSPDGLVEFCGRRDGQVKIRGYRVELGEVEAAAAQVPRVKQVVVVARDGTGTDKRLVGYVVGEGGLTARTMRNALAARLPDYMVPSAWVFLDGLPLTPNGKVDRRNLPDPETQPAGTEHYVAPRTPTEESLVAIWQEVLKIARVGVEDNFFDLGGHSLLMMQVVSRVERVLGIAMPVRSFFEFPTIAALAAEIERRGSQGRVALPDNEIKAAARGAHRVRVTALDPLAGEEHTR